MGTLSRFGATAALVVAAVLSTAPPAAYAGDGYFDDVDLVSAADVPLTTFDQGAGWVTPWDGVRHLAYIGGDQRVVAVSQALDSSTWTWTATPSYFPSYSMQGYAYSVDRSSHIIYTDGNGVHLHELWYSEGSPTWHDADLTAILGIPAGLHTVAAYQDQGMQRILARHYGDLWLLTYRPGSGFSAQNLTAITGKSTHGGVQAYPVQNGTAIFYVDLSRHVRLLTFTSPTVWTDTAVSQAVNAPPVEQNSDSPIALVRHPDGSAVSVSYYGYTDATFTVRHLFQLRRTSTSGWTSTDVTATVGAGNQAYSWLPVGTYFEGDASERYFNRDDSGALIEHVRTIDESWFRWWDRDPTATPLAAFSARESVPGGYTVYVFYFATTGEGYFRPHVMTMTAYLIT